MKETQQEKIKILYLDEGMSVKEISEEIGSSRNSVHATITKFKLNHIRAQRQEQYFDEKLARILEWVWQASPHNKDRIILHAKQELLDTFYKK